MIISHRHRFIFIHCRKSAGSSVEVVLARYLGCWDIKIGGWGDARANGVRPNLRTLLCLFHPRAIPTVIKRILSGRSPISAINRATRDCYRRVGPRSSAATMAHVLGTVWDKYYKFCIIRSPYDRLISDYYWETSGMEAPPEFAEYVSNLEKKYGDSGDGHDGNWNLFTIDNQIAVDKCIRYESLYEELEEVCGRLGVPWDGWLPKAKSGYRKKENLYTEKEIEAVRRLARKEIELFGYEPPTKHDRENGK